MPGLIPTPAPPRFVTNPQPYRGPDPVGQAIGNVMTLGFHAQPGASRAGFMRDLSSFDPRHPAGAVNLATILLPGRGGELGGKLTPEQQGFLQAIYKTSRGQVARYENTPEVQALAGHLGSPLNYAGETLSSEPGLHTAYPPLKSPFEYGGLFNRLGPSSSVEPRWLDWQSGTREAGLEPGRNVPSWAASNYNRSFLQRLFGRYNKPHTFDVSDSVKMINEFQQNPGMFEGFIRMLRGAREHLNPNEPENN